MQDLALLRDGGVFSRNPSTDTALALVHRSFRGVALQRGTPRQRFAAEFPGLGLLNIAHALRVSSPVGFEPPRMAYFDDATYLNEDALAGAVDSWLGTAPRRVIAATAYTHTVDRLEAFLARFDPATTLMLVGGPHAAVAPELPTPHIVVRGEGGAATRHILATVLTDGFGAGSDADGLCYTLDGKTTTRRVVFDRSIERVPPPCYAYDLLPAANQLSYPYSTNFSRVLGERPHIYVCTQSCRARCTFCSTYLIHGRPVARPLAFIREDLAYVKNQLGCDSLEFHDDDLAQHPELPGILALLAELGMPWFCYMRADAITAGLAAEMSAAGCRRVFLGLESLAQETLDYFHKGVTVAQNVAAVHHFSEAGIGVVAGFIIGAPHDTAESILAEVNRFLALPITAINCSVLSPDPGTREFVRHFGRNRSAKGQPVAPAALPNVTEFGAQAPYGLPTVCSAVDKPELNRLQALIDARFYFRPEVWQRLAEHQPPAQEMVLRDYYRFLADSVVAMGDDRLQPAVRLFRDEVLQRVMDWRCSAVLGAYPGEAMA
jgi:hypothetical protein